MSNNSFSSNSTVSKNNQTANGVDYKSILELDAQDVARTINFENLVYIPYGFLRMPEGKMSSRKGNFVTARDILQQTQEEAYRVLSAKGIDNELSEAEKQEKAKKVAITALKWRILYKDIQKDSVLNIPEILNFTGNTGVYQLYTIVRINGILEKLSQNQNSQDQNPGSKIKNNIYDITGQYLSKKLSQKHLAQKEGDPIEKIDNKEDNRAYYEHLKELLNPEEKLILEKILTLSLVLERAKKTHKTHYICNFLYELATAFNSWYGQVKVIQESDDRKLILAIFIWQIQQTMIFCLDLLGIQTVDKL